MIWDALYIKGVRPETEFKEFELRLKFKPRLKFGWFQKKFYYPFLVILNSTLPPCL